MYDKVKCPCCEYYNKVFEGISENEVIDLECEKCEKTFEVSVFFNPIYTGSKIVFMECVDCGKDYRFEGRLYPKPKKYEHLEKDAYTVCEECYRREYIKEIGV